MATKQPTVAALLRKIERLEAQLAVLRESRSKVWAGFSASLADAVELRTRTEQAIRLLQGEDV